MKKKILMVVIGIILIIGIVCIVNINKSKKKYNFTIEKLGDINYFLLMKDNKYGVINKNGDIIVEPIYDVIEIPNPSKDLFICKSNYNADTNEYQVQVFNSKKEAILYQYYIVEGINLNNVEDNVNYEKSILKYKSEGKFGIIDYSGNKITKPIYESIEGFEYNEGLLKVTKSGKYGIINMNGAEIIKPKYDEIISDTYYTDEEGYKSSGYIVGERTDEGMRYGYIDSNRKQLLKNEYNDIYRINKKDEKSNCYLVASKNGKAGVYKGKKNVIKHDYEDIAYNEQNDLLIIQKAGKQGVSRFDGTYVVPIEYSNIFFIGNIINCQKGNENSDIDLYDINGNKEQNREYISKQTYNDKYQIVSISKQELDEYKILINGTDKVIEDNYSYIQYLFDKYFIASKNGKFGIIDDEGKIVIDFKYIVIQPRSGFEIVELITEDRKVTILNNKLEELVQMKSGQVHLINEYIKVSNDSDVKYINTKGKIVDSTEVYSKNKLFSYNENKKWGFKDKNGNVVVKAEYDFVTEFNIYGYAGIKRNNLWGVIDSQGNIIKEPTYELEQNPNFIKEYYEVDLGYGNPYYTN